MTFYISPGSTSIESHNGYDECRLVRRMIDEGHDVQSHSWTHRDLVRTRDIDIDGELRQCRHWVESFCRVNLTGTRYMSQLRPPFGSISPTVTRRVNQAGYTVAMWNVDPRDWRPGMTRERVQDEIRARVTDDVQSHVILLHDRTYHSGLIQWIQQTYQSEYEFVTMSQCYQQCNQPTCD